MSYATFEPREAASSARRTPMRTVLNEFCEAFENAFGPTLEPVEHAAEALAAAPESLPARKVLPKLRDLRHAMQALTDKVAEQQAYVLIFGPLKSGKSTFMNALSAEYVSEVTSLPAYPCMVYVTHSEEPGFVVTHYDGRATTYADRDALRDLVETGHHELTERIREIEAAGQHFDPATHMPEAIRRIDVKIPIDDLSQSGAALVDTPGLYTRMKFGYEHMTRDFRNAAACAIFVVKTDNLFLEQVFDEFGELLELFSRIFLIVNVDSTKMDLQPDGSLAPSLEQQSPWQVVQAFEDLSMTGPLKRAFEQGRLEIYPVDLLRAARRRILARAGRAEPATDETAGQAEFDDVLRDLTEYLNSDEHLRAFVDDSLRRSRSLLEDLGAACDDEAVKTLARDVEQLEDERNAARAQAVTLDRLRHVKWRENALGLARALHDRVGRIAERLDAEAVDAIEAAVGEWFESSQSLYALVDEKLAPAFETAHARLVREIEQTLERRASEDLTTIAGELDALTDLESVGTDVRTKLSAVFEALETRAEAGAPRPHIAGEDIPVRRSVLDWLLLRSGASMRKRLFGPAAYRNAEIAPAVKARRLGEPARSAIREAATTQLTASLERTARELPERLVERFAEQLEQAVLGDLERMHSSVKERLRAAEDRLRELEHVHERIAALEAGLESIRASIDALVERFARDAHEAT